MNSSDYIEVSIRLEPFSEEMAEIAMAELSELPYDSFSVEEPFLKAYIGKEDYDPRALKAVLSGLDARASFSANLMPSVNWNAPWEASFTPIVVGSSVCVRSWEHKEEDVALAFAALGRKAVKTRFNIKITPAMAFGTGHHQTTYMMMQMMLASEARIKGRIVMDMGCGTGVLGILAAKMGAQHVYGIDIDAVAAQSAYDNAHGNRVARRFETRYGDASLLQMGKYDVILANIHRNVILGDLPTYSRSLRPGGLMLLSGFFTGDSRDILKAAASLPLSPAKNAQGETLSLERDGWACLALEKPVRK